MSYLNFLVLSDLHTIISSEGSSISRLLIGNDYESEFADSVIEFVCGLGDTFDAIICCGDIGNRGDEHSFEAGWKFIKKLQEELNNPHLLCVPGNHDHQSRSSGASDGFSPKHNLQFSTPPFPFDCFEKNTHFWAWNWAVSEHEKYNAILLNTSAYHGYEDEYKHGRVALEVSDQIGEYLKSENFSERPVNILVCHHHPVKMEHVDGEYDNQEMNGAPYLLQRLENADVGPWIIFHGHKHFASVSYGPSSNNTPPTIFSAGSLSAVLYNKISDRTSNQIYTIQIDVNETANVEKAVGIFRAYEWDKTRGWRPSRSENLPAEGGFGECKTVRETIRKITDILDGASFLEGEDLHPIQDIIKHYTPSELKKVYKRLKDNGIAVELDGEQKLVQVGCTNE